MQCNLVHDIKIVTSSATLIASNTITSLPVRYSTQLSLQLVPYANIENMYSVTQMRLRIRLQQPVMKMLNVKPLKSFNHKKWCVMQVKIFVMSCRRKFYNRSIIAPIPFLWLHHHKINKEKFLGFHSSTGISTRNLRPSP